MQTMVHITPVVIAETTTMAAYHQCSRKSSDMSDISDGWAQMSGERFHKFE